MSVGLAVAKAAQPRPSFQDGRAPLRLVRSFVWDKAARRERLQALLLILATLVTAAAAASLPPLFKVIVDQDPLAGGAALTGSAMVAVFISVLAVGRLVADLRFWIYGAVEQVMQREIFLRTFDHVHALPYESLAMKRSASLQHVAINGISGARSAVFTALFTALPLLAELVISLLLVGVFLNARYALALAVPLAAYVVIYVRATPRLAGIQKGAIDSFVEASSRASESYSHHESIRQLGAAEMVRRRLDRSLTSAMYGWRDWYRVRTLTGLALSGTIVAAFTLLLAMGWHDLSHGRMTIGEFVLIHAYLVQLLRPIEMLGFAYRELHQGLVNVDRLACLLDEPTRAVDGRGDPLTDPSLSFKDVTYHYPEGSPGLQAITLALSPGTRTALVGPTGSGKSTLLRLATRQVRPRSGHVLIGDHDIDTVGEGRLTEFVTIVPQDPAILHDTLRFNVSLGRGCGIDDAQICDILEEMRLGHLLRADGLDTRLGDRGIRLSGGERQRVAMARAVLRRPRILILDEATSALDPDTEAAVIAVIERRLPDATVLMALHRLHVAQRMDLVVVLDNGAVVERGTHGQLVEQCGVYARLWAARNNHAEFSSVTTIHEDKIK